MNTRYTEAVIFFSKDRIKTFAFIISNIRQKRYQFTTWTFFEAPTTPIVKPLRSVKLHIIFTYSFEANTTLYSTGKIEPANFVHSACNYCRNSLHNSNPNTWTAGFVIRVIWAMQQEIEISCISLDRLRQLNDVTFLIYNRRNRFMPRTSWYRCNKRSPRSFFIYPRFAFVTWIGAMWYNSSVVYVHHL